MLKAFFPFIFLPSIVHENICSAHLRLIQGESYYNGMLLVPGLFMKFSTNGTKGHGYTLANQPVVCLLRLEMGELRAEGDRDEADESHSWFSRRVDKPGFAGVRTEVRGKALPLGSSNLSVGGPRLPARPLISEKLVRVLTKHSVKETNTDCYRADFYAPMEVNLSQTSLFQTLRCER